eukprot:TRINITY_DN2350_c0_g1_i1.p10 TRINITY_DN2350_c0_g1~~TRINITY_DN2350_c0_g1_i1.p10  ORF type:complete len:110 (+),score=9.10 TRINITY_DN2350_c0_g1_i1:2000-2329(+)
MQTENKYASLLDTLTTYAFTPLQELQMLPKTGPKPKPVRVLGKFVETKEGTTLMLDSAMVQCNFKQMRHKLSMNSTAYFECLGEFVIFFVQLKMLARRSVVPAYCDKCP